ncbi:MAG: DUF4038 domain-containing protein, partial [Candidatus Pacebacteria bacterium]|nr:DUF4038 domain-containing protein [Candidatus Paceibacterota bacterium]
LIVTTGSGDPGDTIEPVVAEFSVNPTTVNTNDPITISYTVTDETSLKQVELYRKIDGGDWSLIETKDISGTSASGSFTNSISSAGTYWYGMHVVDEAGNVGYEPITPGPISVEVNSSSDSLQKLRASSDGHYLETTDGEPFMWIAEVLWKMPQVADRDDVTFVLDELSKPEHKYSVIYSVVVMSRQQDILHPTNAYGDQPFYGGVSPDFNSPKVVTGGDPDNPNDYWDHLDFMVRETEERGMYFVLVPQWSNMYINAAWGRNDVDKMDAATARSYGEFLGDRYKNENHIIWMLGGDGGDPFENGTAAIHRAQAEGILKGVTGCTTDCPAYNEPSPLWDEVLMTFHAKSGTRSSQLFGTGDAWINIDACYSCTSRSGDYFGVLTDAYNQAAPMPTIESEGHGFWDDANQVWTGLEGTRAFPYMHYFSGGIGPSNLDEYWHFGPGWRDNINLPERNWVGYMRQIMSSIDWYKLVPDNGIILSNRGTLWAEIIAARSSD